MSNWVDKFGGVGERDGFVESAADDLGLPIKLYCYGCGGERWHWAISHMRGEERYRCSRCGNEQAFQTS